MRLMISLISVVFLAVAAFARAGTDILFIGETHDNPVHHQTQARIVAQYAPKALVFEMLTPAAAKTVMAQGLKNPQALAAALDWEELGWPDFNHYHQIMTAAPDARIYGANVPRTEVRDALDMGVAAYFGKAAEAYGLTTPLPADQQKARETAQQEAHCGMLPDQALPRMVDAQRLRDAQLARSAQTALAETGGPVVVITGNGHARRDWGAPAYLARVMDPDAIRSIGQGEDGTPPEGRFDELHDAPAPKRDDPCAAFQQKSGGN